MKIAHDYHLWAKMWADSGCFQRSPTASGLFPIMFHALRYRGGIDIVTFYKSTLDAGAGHSNLGVLSQQR
jgi:hypothetical protein